MLVSVKASLAHGLLLTVSSHGGGRELFFSS